MEHRAKTSRTGVSMFDNSVTDYEKPWVRVSTFGGIPQMFHHPEVLDGAKEAAVAMGADRDKVCVLVPASDQSKDHFKRILPAAWCNDLESRIWADGTYTAEPNSAVIVPVADCMVFVAKNLITNTMVVGHAGKPALRTWNHQTALSSTEVWDPTDDYEHNIIKLGLDIAAANSFTGEIQLSTFAAIGARHYRHHDENSRIDRERFLLHYGEEAFYGDPAEGNLDLRAMAYITARKAKMRDSQIKTDHTCTVCNPILVSNRQDTDQRNLVIAVNRAQNS